MINTSTALVVSCVMFGCGGLVDSGGDAATESGSGHDLDAANAAESPNATDANISEAAPPPDGGACNSLVNGGPAVDLTQMNVAPPSPMGGAIQAGLYYLTAYHDYNGESGTIPLGIHGVVSISGSDLDVLEANVRTSATFIAINTMLNVDETCPTMTSYTEPYSAIDGGLIFYRMDQSDNTVMAIYTKQ